MTDSRVFRTAKYVVIIMIAGILGIFLGRFMMRYETRLFFSREYCGTYRGIEVYKCGELNNDNVISHLFMLERAPDKLVENCKAIYFTGESIAVPEMSGEAALALGLTQDSTVFITTTSFFADVLYHELYHVFDNANGKLSDTEEFRALFEKERASVVVDCLVEENERAEFFAAAGAQYLINPGLLKSKAPETFNYFFEMIGAEPGFTVSEGNTRIISEGDVKAW